MDARGTPHCYAFVFCERAEFDEHNRVTVHRVLGGPSCARGVREITAYVCLGLTNAAPGVDVQINLFNSTGRLLGHSHASISCDSTGIAQAALILRDVALAEPGECRAELQTRAGDILATRRIVVEGAASAGGPKTAPMRVVANPA